MTEEAKKRKMVAAAPAWLKGRVERGEELPSIAYSNSSSHSHNGDTAVIDGGDEKEEEGEYDHDENEIEKKEEQKDKEQEMMKMRADLMEFLGVMAKEVFVELMEQLVPKWDDARRS